MNDEKIIELYYNRNELAIAATAERYGAYCHAVAYNILHNEEDSQESVNDTYMSAWNSIPPHKPTILKTFLGKIARRFAINKWRKKMPKSGAEVP